MASGHAFSKTHDQHFINALPLLKLIMREHQAILNNREGVHLNFPRLTMKVYTSSRGMPFRHGKTHEGEISDTTRTADLIIYGYWLFRIAHNSSWSYIIYIRHRRWQFTLACSSIEEVIIKLSW